MGERGGGLGGRRRRTERLLTGLTWLQDLIYTFRGGEEMK